jgi:hypothetical protein
MTQAEANLIITYVQSLVTESDTTEAPTNADQQV